MTPLNTSVPDLPPGSRYIDSFVTFPETPSEKWFTRFRSIVSGSELPPTVVTPKVPFDAPAVTTAVCADSAAPVPYAFVAVTAPRSVAPTSAAVTRYDDCVAPEIEVQFAPDASQRSHW